MLQTTQSKRKLGEVLLNGAFISHDHLEQALAEQEATNERIGEILVRLGFLSQMELHAVLAFHLDDEDSLEDEASAIRYKLGEILLKSGKIKRHQLEGALAEQEATNEKLGEVLVRLGLLSQDELGALLEWQHEHTRNSAKAVRFMLGEILVATRAITRDELKKALAEQRLSSRQIGDVLIETGMVKPNVLAEALRIQGKLVAASLVAVVGAGFLAGCGTGMSLTGVQVATSGSNFQTATGLSIPVHNNTGTIWPYGATGAGGGGGRTISSANSSASQISGTTTQLANGHSYTDYGDGSRVIDNVPWFHQDATVNNDGVTPDNTCAQAASTMVLHYWQGTAAPSYQDVVNQANHFNLATSASTLTGYLQHEGLQVNAYKNGNINFLKASVDAGHPVICMLDFDGVPHYIVVIGYNDTTGTILYHDSIDGPNMSLDSSEFLYKWTHNTVSGLPIVGGDNYIGLAVDAHS